MRSLALFALSFALVARAAPPPSLASQTAPADVAPSDLPYGGTPSLNLSSTGVSGEVNLNAAPDGYIPEPEATAVPWGSRSCNATSGTPGVDCPFTPAPADYSCVEATNGAQFWLGGYIMGCAVGTHCDMALGGGCYGAGSPWLTASGAADAQQTSAGQATQVTVLAPPIISYVYISPVPEYPTSLESTTQPSTTDAPPTDIYTQPSPTSGPPVQGGTIDLGAYPSATGLSAEESARFLLSLLSASEATQASATARPTLPGGGRIYESKPSGLASPSATSHTNVYESRLSGLAPSASNPGGSKDYRALLSGLNQPGPEPTKPPTDQEPASVREAKSKLSGMTALGEPTG